MKQIILLRITALAFLFVIQINAQRPDNVDINSGNGRGFRFWNGSNSYKIHMGNSSEYKYGPVTDFSIKTNMNGTTGRGWTWGIDGKTPIAALSNVGNFQVGGFFTSKKVSFLGSSTSLTATSSLRVQNNYGYLDLGPRNVSWCHIYTDMPKIIFNKDVYTTSNAFSSYNNDLILKTKGTERFRIDDVSGNIGIGTTSPKNKLSVNGTIWAKKVKVRLSDAADWVFDTDYDLPTLTEVAAYIKENKHLPEVPSAEEFRANDMEVSAMTNMLLQKIEELTLYAIEQENKLKEQAVTLKKVAALEARLLQLENSLSKR